MRNRITILLLATFAFTAELVAQVPIATGRTLAMSNAAWSIFVPTEYVQRGGVADVIYHFHGDPATFRNNAKYANLNAVRQNHRSFNCVS